MSHHVVVRDDQEAALVVANGLACSPELLGQLLEWSPLVVALDGAFDRLTALGIKVDVVLGDMDSVGRGQWGAALQKGDSHAEEAVRHHVEAAQDGVRWVYTPDQEYTDLQKALQWLWDNGHRSAQVIWANGPGPDHFFGNLHALATAPEGMAVGMLQEDTRTFRAPKLFSKCYHHGDRLSLIPFPEALSVTTQNLEFALDAEDLKAGQRIGISNRVLQSGLVRINHAGGCLLLSEPLYLNAS
ncbi:MAG: thiamine diphosphokinase [Bacteroidota bacterium]